VAPAIVAGLVPAGVLLVLLFVSWPLAIVLAPFLIYAGASPVLGRRRIDTLGSQARNALGTLGAFATESIQGLAELAAFDATGRRRVAFMAAVRRYQDTRIQLLEDLTWQTAGLEVATGLGGLGVAALGAPLALRLWRCTAGFLPRCCRCWCSYLLRRSCQCRRSPRWGGSWPTPSRRRGGCTWCTPSRW
jgi:ATP-binding cassette subfamily C protein CydCD